MDKKDDSSNMLLVILILPVYLTLSFLAMLVVFAASITKGIFEFFKMPYKSWRDRQNGSFKTEILVWLLILGFFLLCIYAITADIRSGGKYSREDRSHTDYLDDISWGAGVSDL